MVNELVDEVKSATVLRFNDLWKRNFQANLSKIRQSPGVQSLKNKFKELPCVVVGAGPSLDKNIQHLSHIKENALIIAGDAALKPLLSHNIIPSIVVCLDPQEDIAKFFTGVSHQGMTLVAPTIVHPKILDVWEGRVVFYNKYAPDIPLLTQIQNALPKLGVLTPGGTVLSVAYDLAFQSASDPIIFVGQDLSYENKTIYARGGETGNQNWDTICHNQSENIVYETDIRGQKLPTIKAMSVTKQWFHWAFTNWKRNAQLTIYNCSEGGILTDHCEWISFREAIYKYCGKKVNAAWTIKKAFK
jgi:hypothetical protein